MPSGQNVFKVDPRPDGGEFVNGNSAALAWDVLQRTGKHKIPDVIDLSGCLHLKPYSLACLCGLGELGKHNNRPIQAIQPEDEECANHLARLGVPDFFECNWKTQVQRDSNLPVRRVTWPPHNAAREIIELLVSVTDLPPGIFPTMVESLDEVIRNALTHAVSPVDCLVAGQAFPGTDKVEVAVLDLGQTIRGHLTKNPEFVSIDTDEQAILKAMEDGVTGTLDGHKNIHDEDNSGAGLAELRTYCESGGGEVSILSGTKWITCRPEDKPVSGDLWSGFRGCLVNIRFFTGNSLQLEEIEPIL